MERKGFLFFSKNGRSKRLLVLARREPIIAAMIPKKERDRCFLKWHGVLSIQGSKRLKELIKLRNL